MQYHCAQAGTLLMALPRVQKAGGERLVVVTGDGKF
jgi:hypothetical protein